MNQSRALSFPHSFLPLIKEERETNLQKMGVKGERKTKSSCCLSCLAEWSREKECERELYFLISTHLSKKAAFERKSGDSWPTRRQRALNHGRGLMDYFSTALACARRVMHGEETTWLALSLNMWRRGFCFLGFISDAMCLSSTPVFDGLTIKIIVYLFMIF